MLHPSTPSSAVLYCSFCRKDWQRVAKLVAGPGVYICDACVSLCNRVIAGKRTPTFGGWDSLTDDQLLATLPAAVAAVDTVEEKLREHVAMLRKREVSWERIAAALGVTRQAAWERFSREM
jgi:hypothetical protein